jgi:N-acetyl-beta-hexosaminidase
MDYNSLALLTFQAHRQSDEKQQEQMYEQITKLIEECPHDDLSTLYETNANFANKMSETVHEAGNQLYTKALLETDTTKAEHYLNRALTTVADSVIWDAVATELFEVLEAMETDEECDEEECEEYDENEACCKDEA